MEVPWYVLLAVVIVLILIVLYFSSSDEIKTLPLLPPEENPTSSPSSPPSTGVGDDQDINVGDTKFEPFMILYPEPDFQGEPTPIYEKNAKVLFATNDGDAAGPLKEANLRYKSIKVEPGTKLQFQSYSSGSWDTAKKTVYTNIKNLEEWIASQEWTSRGYLGVWFGGSIHSWYYWNINWYIAVVD